MRRVLDEIQSGRFAREWVLENQANRPVYNAMLAKGEAHPIEDVASRLRAKMPWLKKDKLVYESKNSRIRSRSGAESGERFSRQIEQSAIRLSGKGLPSRPQKA